MGMVKQAKSPPPQKLSTPPTQQLMRILKGVSPGSEIRKLGSQKLAKLGQESL
jgi:hypothetical protein